MGFLELRQEPGVYSRVTAGMSIRNSSLFIEVRNLSIEEETSQVSIRIYHISSVVCCSNALKFMYSQCHIVLILGTDWVILNFFLTRTSQD